MGIVFYLTFTESVQLSVIITAVSFFSIAVFEIINILGELTTEKNNKKKSKEYCIKVKI